MAQYGGGMPPPPQPQLGRGPAQGPPPYALPPAGTGSPLGSRPSGYAPGYGGGYAPGSAPSTQPPPAAANQAAAAGAGPPRLPAGPAANGAHPPGVPFNPQRPPQQQPPPQQAHRHASHHPKLRYNAKPLAERLRRDTPFLCNIRFHNDLPEIPSDPKLLLTQPDAAALSAFFLTASEKDPRRELLQSSDVGVPVSLLDMERYNVPPPDQQQPMDEADAQIVEMCQALLTNGTSAKVKRSSGLDVNWLMRTTYIASVEGGERKAAKTSSRPMGALPEVDLEAQRVKQIADIEETFETIKQPVLQHPNPAKRHLTPVEVLPVLPDFENWADKFVNVQFDTDPALECSQLAGLPPAIRRQLLERSMLKGFRPDDTGQRHEQCMALLLPKQALAAATAGEELGAGQEVSDLEGSYSWALEYLYQLEQYSGAVEEDAAADATGRGKAGTQDKYLLQMYPDVVTYCPLEARLKLRKRRRHASDAQAPEEVRVHHRELQESELLQRQDRSLIGRTVDGEEEVLED